MKGEEEKKKRRKRKRKTRQTRVTKEIDMGPDGGEGGGQVVAKGTPEQVSGAKNSATAPYLRQILNKYK